MIVRAAAAALSPAGPRARLAIFIFHRVHRVPDPLFPGEADAAGFDAACGWLARWFRVLPLHEAVQRLSAGTLPARAAAITFDDGYADNHDVALPLLRRHGLTATFFVATGFLDGGCMWNDIVIEAMRHAPAGPLAVADLLPAPGEGEGNGDGGGDHDREAPLAPLVLGDAASRRDACHALIVRLKYLPPAERAERCAAIARRAGSPRPPTPMMTGAQVRALHHAGMGIGAHTLTHPILARLPRAAIEQEVLGSRRALESLLGAPVPLFAYPNGKPGEDYGPEAVAVVREAGFAAAVSTAWGAAGAGSEAHQLPRFTPWGRERWRWAALLLDQLRRPVPVVRHRVA
jgi:peptidoglycan/xylan/chitin deacetylase (PgdA/CDA1 family)